jgi:small acid-soluble spore protein H (minor)
MTLNTPFSLSQLWNNKGDGCKHYDCLTISGGVHMNKQRAHEIVSSPEMVRVTYNGEPIYIQNVDEKQDTARIYPLDQPENEQSVPLNLLQEES